VDAVTHRRVAAAAGVPLGSTTYYFDSREHLLRDAFRHYIQSVSETISELSERAKRRPSVRGIVDLLISLTEREFLDEALLIAEFELTLFAARDPELALELHAWQDAMLADLAEALEFLGAPRPFDAARSVLQMVRGYEQEQLTRHEARSGDLRRRLQTQINAFLGS
jgi:DNA-binding transcriptional regulator YbjK